MLHYLAAPHVAKAFIVRNNIKVPKDWVDYFCDLPQITIVTNADKELVMKTETAMQFKFLRREMIKQWNSTDGLMDKETNQKQEILEIDITSANTNLRILNLIVLAIEDKKD